MPTASVSSKFHESPPDTKPTLIHLRNAYNVKMGKIYNCNNMQCSPVIASNKPIEVILSLCQQIHSPFGLDNHIDRTYMVCLYRRTNHLINLTKTLTKMSSFRCMECILLAVAMGWLVCFWVPSNELRRTTILL